MQAPSLGLEDPMEEGMATHSSILAWRIPWTERWTETKRQQTQLLIKQRKQKSRKTQSAILPLVSDSVSMKMWASEFLIE